MNEEPVEIDIVMRQNVADEAEKATRAIDKLSEASAAVQGKVAESIATQKAAIRALQKELEPLKKQIAELVAKAPPSDASKFEAMAKSVDALEAQLLKASNALGKMDADAQSYATRIAGTEERIRALTEEISHLNAAGETEKTVTQEKQTALEAYIEARNALLEALEKTADKEQMQELAPALEELSGQISEAQQNTDAYGESSEALNGALQNVKSMLAILRGELGINNKFLNKAVSTAGDLTKNTRLLTGATKELARGLGISTIAAKALMATLTFGLSAAISGVSYLVGKYIQKLRDAKAEQERFRNSAAQSAASQIANYEKLRRSYNQLGDDIKAKEKFILENKAAFDQLGISINDVNDADNLFIFQTEAFKSAVDQRARAAASMEFASEKYKSAMSKRLEAEKREVKPNAWEQLTGINDFYFNKDGKRVLRNKKARAAADDIRKEADEYEKQARKLVEDAVNFEKEASEQLKQANIDAANTVEEGTKAWWENKKKLAQQRLDAMKDSQKDSEEWKKTVKEIQDADAALKKYNVRAKSKTTGKSEENKRKQAGKKLAQLSADIEKEIDAATVAAMEEGREKKLRQLKADYDARTALIEKRKKEIEELEKTAGMDGSKQKAQLDALSDAEKTKYEAKVKAVTRGLRQAIAEVMAEINARFRTENENRLADIDAFYKEQIKKAKENGATQAELDHIALQHTRDIELEKQHIALETLDLEAQIAIKRTQLENRRLLLQSEREEKILQVQIEAAKKRLAKLKELEDKGDDVGKEIKATTVEIEAMNAELEQIPLKKLQEYANIAQDIGAVFNQIAGMVDEDTGNLADILTGYFGGSAEFGVGLTRTLAGDPQGIQQMLGGVQKVLGSVKKVINANKEANNAIREFNLSIAQQAIDYSLAVIRAIKDVKSETDSIFSSNYTNTLVQGMESYNAAITKQTELMRKLGDVSVKTGVKKKKFLGITYGHKDVYESLLKKYPKLIDKNGELNRELAESLKKSGNLSKEATTLIDNILHAEDAAKEAMQAVESELQSLVGTIGTDLKKALDDAFASGTDSAKEMKESVAKMLKELASQKLFNAVFGGIFSTLEDRMKKSFGEGGDRDLTDDIKWFMDEYTQHVSEYNKGLEQLREAIKEQYGNDPFTDGEGRKAVAKGIAQASQDSIDELNGRLTFLVMKVSENGTLSASQLDIEKEQLYVQQAMLGHIEIIAENSEFLKKLDAISEDISKLVRDGLYLKK